MLPSLDPNGGRGALKDFPRNGNEAVVALPRLRLLRQVGTEVPRGPGGESRNSSPRDTDELDVPRRGRGLLRPHGEKERGQTLARSPSVPPQLRQQQLSPEDNSFTPHNDARQRVRQHNRQRRRKVREEDERRASEERDRQDRVQRSLPQVEAHRREAGKRAAELHRRDRVEKETAFLQQDQLNSARREKTKRYMNPEAINDLRRTDQKLPSLSRPIGPQVLRDISSSESKERPLVPDSSGNRRAHRPPSEEDTEARVFVSGSFASGGVRGRPQPQKSLLSPRRRDGARQVAAESNLQEAIPKTTDLLETEQVSAGAENSDVQKKPVPPPLETETSDAAAVELSELDPNVVEAAAPVNESSENAGLTAPPEADTKAAGPETSRVEMETSPAEESPVDEKTSPAEEQKSPAEEQTSPAEETTPPAAETETEMPHRASSKDDSIL
mmetsp:Transcript_98796/g.175944  ORF Transcript_98796/g.175944 Transcript_98796/m.175944 type:complete len:443 (-) Transcript_98796:52-1380(-)|eukprot:CAMPEP_0197628354 /NCGR_PEP_ID=MMETSP1338-20131121/6697_1 /TAXON_ID=43686 ORGANISM="Pelagodinium beii, Strain RCC1491" /NCGR_SAMPLE_ID=MMETSP1338 /ASSEMBLY_ACC=CAM_ASM_000754 /LENGTH=442 /DNA_ID=CAMNT_0043199315 /DNA_START=58 /DNA_END=1386 /DNA_ORIENTATION=+